MQNTTIFVISFPTCLFNNQIYEHILLFQLYIGITDKHPAIQLIHAIHPAQIMMEMTQNVGEVKSNNFRHCYNVQWHCTVNITKVANLNVKCTCSIYPKDR